MVVGLTQRLEQYFVINCFSYRVSALAFLGDGAAVPSSRIDLWAFLQEGKGNYYRWPSASHLYGFLSFPSKS